MSNYLIIWGLGILIFSPFIIWHYQKKPDDRLSWLATALILILWPLTFISMLFLFSIVWIEERFAKDDSYCEYKK
ncbi:hypothetical protein ABN072_01900 [Providencia rettgeri]|uniref:hypothetical protein n=1 Tax=Providencia rettgeri TaxID=587 RepID=UPI0032DA3024